MKPRRNVPGGLLGIGCLLVVALPLYFMVATSLRRRSEYLAEHPLSLPDAPNLDNYATVLSGGFGGYLVNTVVVTAATVLLVIGLSLPAAFAITRSPSRQVQRGFSLLLAGLACPAQATIIPIYLIITRLHLYDSLTAIVLPTAAFSLPVAVLVLTGSLRDVPAELYDAQAIDGAGPGRVLRYLVLPLSRPAVVAVAVFTALSAWNGFLFPLVLTQSESTRVLTLGLWNFQGQFGTDVPALLAAVTLSVLPMFALYLIGRRFLISGLTAGFSR